LMRLHLQKERLTAFVVHDLKNPVSSMDLHAQMLLRDKGLSAHARDSVQRIREEARSLLRLVVNLLDISKSEEGQLAPKRAPIDLDVLLLQVQEEHEITARNAGVLLKRVVNAPIIVGDADLLRRVIENLVENAIRHAPQGSEVLLRSTPLVGAIEIHVADAGPGVSPELREKIFERFVQLDFGDRVVSRTSRGLGLAFCKLAVEAHGGAIRIDDGNPGSVFCVRLPHES
jgi:two-component system sensor histidine kinase/response regulator